MGRPCVSCIATMRAGMPRHMSFHSLRMKLALDVLAHQYGGRIQHVFLHLGVVSQLVGELGPLPLTFLARGVPELYERARDRAVLLDHERHLLLEAGDEG